MEAVDASVIIKGDVDLDEDVAVGPYCVLDATLGPISIGAGTRLIGNVYVQGPAVLGESNTVYPFTCFGFAPQSTAFDPSIGGPGVVIGDRNLFREGVTIHRAMTDAGPTTLGHDNFFMTNSHAAHDVRLGDHCVLATGAVLGGHAEVGSHVTLGGMAGVHQHCRVGRGCMLAGTFASVQDLPPFFMLTGPNCAGSLNIIGMRRQKMPRDWIDDIRWVYRMLYRKGLTVPDALDELRTRADRPMVAEYIEFIETSKRGICPAEPSRKRQRV